MNIKDNSIPIYQQIMTLLEYDVASGRLLPGEKLESIRDLAVKYKVNPNTMARALSELETSGLIYTDRTNGKFVVKDLDVLSESKSRLMKRDTHIYIEKVRNLKLNKKEVLDLINDLWED